MSATKTKAAELKTRAAHGKTHKADCLTRTEGTQAGKAFAVFLYNVGARSLQDTQGAFDRHPEWAAA